MARRYVSASQIDTANYCRMRYYLKYFHPNKPKPLRISPYVKGGLLHGLIETFWLFLDPTVYASNLDITHEVPEFIQRQRTHKKQTKNSNWHKDKIKPKYDSPESFGKYSLGRWKKLVVQNKKCNDPTRKIYWRNGFDDDSEAWEIGAIIPRICEPVFEELYEEGPPMYSELNFEFVLGGIRFFGYIDEVKLRERDGEKKVVIRDYKSGSPWGIQAMKRDFDPQLTFYNAGLCAKSFHSEEFAKSLDLEKIRHKFMGNPMHINPDFEEEFFMVEAPSLHRFANTPPPEKPLPPVDKKQLERLVMQSNPLELSQDELLSHAIFLQNTLQQHQDFLEEYGKYREELGTWRQARKKLNNLPTTIHLTSRTDQHFFALVQNYKSTIRAIRDGDITFESGKKCDSCDMKLSCMEESKKVGKPAELKDRKGNQLFDFMAPPYQQPVEVQPSEFDVHPPGKQKVFAWGRGENTSRGRVPKN